MQRTSAEKLGFSAQQLGRIQPLLQTYIDEDKIKGVSTMILRHGQIAYESYQGLADAETNLPMQPDILYRIFSMSKPITIVALLTLFEHGLFRLEDPVSAYMPVFADVKVMTGAENGQVQTAPATQPITIKHLCMHTAGYMYPDGHEAVGKLYQEQLRLDEGLFSGHTTRKFADALATLPLLFEPGTRWQYGFSIDVLGALIETLSGLSFGEYLRTALFEPLGMNDSAFWVPEDKLNRLSAMYEPAEGGGLIVVDKAPDSGWNKPPSFESGGGGLIASMEDYARFSQMLVNGGALGGQRILGRKTVELMATDHLTPDLRPSYNWEAERGNGFGLGVRVLRDLAGINRPGSIGEYGWGGAASTWVCIDPQEDLVGLIMPQLIKNPGHPFIKQFATMLYAALD